MPIYTRRGDKGETDVLGGVRLPKDHLRIEAIGQIDEFNALLGIVMSFSEDEKSNALLKEIQKDIFVIGAEFAASGSKAKLHKRIGPQRVAEIEQEIDKIEAQISPLHHFILPGGSKTASLLHLARTVNRRAERAVVALSRKEKVDPQIITYLNRLSDLLFVMARLMNRRKRIEEVIWQGR
jgi:cob(I)alamin adenosyltransferase